MIRKILIPLDSTSYTTSAINIAAGIAKKAAGNGQVSIEGLGIVDVDQIPSGRFASLVPRDEIIQESRQEVEKIMKNFREQAISLGIPENNVTTRYVEGSPFQTIMDNHVFSDIVIIGEKCGFHPDLQDYMVLEEVFHRSSRPIIISQESSADIDKVVMALDGTASSSRMIFNYIHLNPFPNAKLVVAHTKLEEGKIIPLDFFDRLEEFLSSHNFEFEQILLEGNLFEAIPALVKENNAKAIALGIHRKHFLGKLIRPMHIGWSSVEKLLNEIKVALFTVH